MVEIPDEHEDIVVSYEMHASFRTFSDGSMIIWQDEDRCVKLTEIEVRMLHTYLNFTRG